MSVASAARPAAVAVDAAADRRRHRLPGGDREDPSQLLPRLAAVACLLGPLAFTVFINTQSSVPADSLFGRWVHSSGFAVPLVVLGFAGDRRVPALASVVAGDIFASEDGHATWKTVLTRSCSRGDVFWGKCLAAMPRTRRRWSRCSR